MQFARLVIVSGALGMLSLHEGCLIHPISGTVLAASNNSLCWITMARITTSRIVDARTTRSSIHILATPNRSSHSTSVWEVEISPDTPSTPHRLTQEEVFVVLSGEATVRIGDATSLAEPGDSIVVPVDTDFAISAAGSENLRAICCLPVGGKAVLPDGTSFVPPWAE